VVFATPVNCIACGKESRQHAADEVDAGEERAGPTRAIMDPGGIQGLSGIKITERIEDISKAKRPGKRPSSPERWELAQLKHAGVLKVTQYPDFDADGEVGPALTPRVQRLDVVSPLAAPPNKECGVAFQALQNSMSWATERYIMLRWQTGLKHIKLSFRFRERRASCMWTMRWRRSLRSISVTWSPPFWRGRPPRMGWKFLPSRS